MGRVWLLQLICPNRHTIIAAPYEKESEEQALEVAADMRAQMRENGLKWECGLCKSTDLKFEEGATRFMSMDEAMPNLRKIEAENIISRVILEEMNGPFPLERPSAS